MSSAQKKNVHARSLEAENVLSKKGNNASGYIVLPSFSWYNTVHPEYYTFTYHGKDGVSDDTNRDIMTG